MNKREELQSKLQVLDEKRAKIYNEIKLLNYKSRLEDASKYLGKYYIEVDKYSNNYIRCIYVYSIDKENCCPISLEVSYWNDNSISYFTIASNTNFFPSKWEEFDGEDNWNEITRKDFMKHYNLVQKEISNSVNLKTYSEDKSQRESSK